MVDGCGESASFGMILFEKVTKTFPSGFTALSEVDFKVESSEFCFLVGPSGAGKTTLFRLLIAEFLPSSGKVFFEDYDIAELDGRRRREHRRNIGVSFQDLKLLPERSVFENVALGLEILGKGQEEIEEEVKKILKLVNLEDHRDLFPIQLSGGELQRVSIARAIAGNPRVLLADEPTANLDPAASWEIMELLVKVHQDLGTTVVAATHNVDVVNSLKKRVVHLEKGKVVKDVKEGKYS